MEGQPPELELPDDVALKLDTPEEQLEFTESPDVTPRHPT